VNPKRQNREIRLNSPCNLRINHRNNIKKVKRHFFKLYTTKNPGKVKYIRYRNTEITIEYLDHVLVFYIYPQHYEYSLRKIKFMCTNYSFDHEFTNYLDFFFDENLSWIFELANNDEELIFKVNKEKCHSDSNKISS
jgi:hypothetical protein